MEVRGRPLHFGIQLQGSRTSWAEYVSAVRAVEDLGYGSVWTFDHLLPHAGRDDLPCFETLTTLAAMAVVTSRARIGVLVNGVLYREPVVLAKAAAQVDEISGGRLDFSLGAAWAEREFRAYGMQFPSQEERYARLDEALQLVKLLWTEHRTTFHGRYYHVDDAPCEPKPVQSPYPPITVGGSGLGLLRIAARHATRLNLIASPGKCAERVGKLKQICAEIGRDFDDIELSVHPVLALAPTYDQGEAIAQRVAASDSVDLEDLRSTWVIGGPSEVADRLRQYMDVGVSHFVFALGHPFDFEPFRLLTEEVVPALVS